jgi:hypothetical protein
MGEVWVKVCVVDQTERCKDNGGYMYKTRSEARYLLTCHMVSIQGI